MARTHDATGRHELDLIHAVLDLVAHPLEARAGDLERVALPRRQRSRPRQHLRLTPVDHVRGAQEWRG